MRLSSPRTASAGPITCLCRRVSIRLNGDVIPNGVRVSFPFTERDFRGRALFTRQFLDQRSGFNRAEHLLELAISTCKHT